ncbi:MAG: hypothetical protein SFU98_12825 [Leptospiraceae bacterium]|nr:hypothetical protein [Leptospiraceae bacterium]
MFRLILILILMNIGLFAETDSKSPIEVFKAERIPQGDIFLSQAKNYYADKEYHQAIEKLIDFIILYPNHPEKLKAQKLLSLAYQFNDEWEKSVEVDMKIFRENPTVENGLSSYLDAARKLVKMGRETKAKSILESLTKQMYSNKIAKEAEIELVQMKILESN